MWPRHQKMQNLPLHCYTYPDCVIPRKISEKSMKLSSFWINFLQLEGRHLEKSTLKFSVKNAIRHVEIEFPSDLKLVRRDEIIGKNHEIALVGDGRWCGRIVGVPSPRMSWLKWIFTMTKSNVNVKLHPSSFTFDFWKEKVNFTWRLQNAQFRAIREWSA